MNHDLRCPYCDETIEPAANSCKSCGLPLLQAPREYESASGYAPHLRPEYCGGALQRITVATSQAEAELVQGMLTEEGIPSVVTSSKSFDLADLTADGRRDVFVPEDGVEAARDLLCLSPEALATANAETPNPTRLLLAILIGLLLLMAVAFAVGAFSSLYS